MSAGEQEFCGLWQEAESSLFAFIRMMNPNTSDLDDIVQETAMTAFRKFATYDAAKSSFATWVRGIAKFEVLNRRRSYARSKVMFSSETLDLVAETVEQTEEEEADERLGLLKRCMADLPEDQKRMLELKYVHGRSSEEIGQIMGISAGNARIRLMRLRDSLFERMSAPEPAG